MSRHLFQVLRYRPVPGNGEWLNVALAGLNRDTGELVFRTHGDQVGPDGYTLDSDLVFGLSAIRQAVEVARQGSAYETFDFQQLIWDQELAFEFSGALVTDDADFTSELDALESAFLKTSWLAPSPTVSIFGPGFLSSRSTTDENPPEDIEPMA